MNFTDVITYLFPYLQSFRRLKDYLSIDLIFPKNWDFPNEIIQKCQVVQNEKHQGDGINLSFVSKLDNELESLIDVIEELINHNLEREEKERLLRLKVSELKELFKNSTLNDLKGLSIVLDNEEDEDSVEKLLEDEE
jgi:transcriptional regulator of heat shock response